MYTRSFRYLQTLLNSTKRYDLLGEEVEDISESEIEYTKTLLDHKRKKAKEEEKTTNKEKIKSTDDKE